FAACVGSPARVWLDGSRTGPTGYCSTPSAGGQVETLAGWNGRLPQRFCRRRMIPMQAAFDAEPSLTPAQYRALLKVAEAVARHGVLADLFHYLVACLPT